MLAALTALAGLLALTTLVGVGVAALLRRPTWTWLVPATGLCALMVIAAPAAYLPGGVVVPWLLAGALAITGARRLITTPTARPPARGLALALPTLALVALPFLANGRTGVLGVSFNNDTAAHLLLIEAMFSPSSAAAVPLLEYYPLGPHGVMAMFAALGLPTDLVLTAFICAIPVLTAVTAQAFLEKVNIGVAAVGSALIALPYLVASYLAQGAFKETMMALLMIALAVAMDEARDRDDELRYVPVALLCAGVVSTYSYIGLVWPVAALGLLASWDAAATWHRTRRLTAVPASWKPLVFPTLTALVIGILLCAPQLPRVQAFREWQLTSGIPADDLGNLAGPLSPREMLGVWLWPDFRFEPPTHPTLTLIGGLLVAALAAWSIAWWVRNTPRPTVPLFMAAALVLVFLAERNQSPYTVAKAMVIVAPLLMLTIVSAVGRGAPSLPIVGRGAVLATAGVATAALLWSTGLALRGAQVGPRDHTTQLDALRATVRGHQVLYLGTDDFASWRLRGATVKQPFYGWAMVTFNPAKPWEPGKALDADSLAANEIDQFGFVVRPRDASSSAMPENFRLVRRTKSFELWQRSGAGNPRLILPTEGSNASAVLACSTAAGRRILRGGGVAGVRPPSVAVAATPTTPRRASVTALPLTRGTWSISLDYVSARPMEVTAAGLKAKLPAVLDRMGNRWPVGTVNISDERPTIVTIRPQQREFAVDAATPVLLGTLTAQRHGKQVTIPLKQACGRNVDWYRPAQGGTGQAEKGTR